MRGAFCPFRTLEEVLMARRNKDTADIHAKRMPDGRVELSVKYRGRRGSLNLVRPDIYDNDPETIIAEAEAKIVQALSMRTLPKEV